MEILSSRSKPWSLPTWSAWPGSLLGSALGLFGAFLLRDRVDDAHGLLAVIGCVVGVSALWGRGPGAFAAVVSTLAYDFFFLPPRYSFRVSGPHLVSLILLVAIALAVGQLAALLRRQADRARVRQANAQATAQLARDLTGAVTTKQAVEITRSRMKEIFGFEPQISLESGVPSIDPSELVLPLKAPRKVRGTMKFERKAVRDDDLALLETFAAVCALSLERIHFVEVAQDALLRMEGERMRSHVLSCLSHDLRTPLTGIVVHSQRLSEGLADPGSIAEAAGWGAVARELHGEASKMADLVENLLELARLQSGGVRLRLDWHSVDDLCASALRHRRGFLDGREIRLDLGEGLPLIQCDGVLVERVLVNLLDNAQRYAPGEEPFRLWARSLPKAFQIGLDDNGPGLAAFGVDRGPEGRRGAGIGLSLCRAIAQAHGGSLLVEDVPGGGARVSITLPQTNPLPEMPVEEDS